LQTRKAKDETGAGARVCSLAVRIDPYGLPA